MTDRPENKGSIIYTITDEAPALATYSLFPIVKSFSSIAGIKFETRDISLAGRMIAKFSHRLPENLRQNDDLEELGELVTTAEANVIKLPNISASVPQIQATVKELREKGYDIPDYVDNPATQDEIDARDRFDKIKGSAVNPVLREGNSDRRAPLSVKNYAKAHPHSMGKWTTDSKSHVSHMDSEDFFHNEISFTVAPNQAGDCRIEHVDADGKITVLKEKSPVMAGEIVDTTHMNVSALRSFIREQIKDAREKGVLFSVHLKATMMKVSDPVIFGHFVTVFFEEVMDKHAETLKNIGFNPNNGLGDLYSRLPNLPEEKRIEIENDIRACYEMRPALAMVNSDKGITNLHVPSDVIIDASMPAAIRTSGRMWGPDGKAHDTKFIIPDRSYAKVYSTAVDYCKETGAFDPRTMGTVQNIGLMAQKAEEYGSHDKTFMSPKDGTIRLVSPTGEILSEQKVQKGDIFRMCQVRDLPIQDWVKLAVKRARITGYPTIFWLNKDRAHDLQVINKVNLYLKNHDTEGLDIRIMPPSDACRLSCELIREGKNTISVTGNVLRDYLTDLFPILEVGTSAKMLSIVPLMQGGGLFETGAGGSAPKHVQQFVEEGHLRWDSLGEFLAIAASLEHFAQTFKNDRARVLSETLDRATGKFLEENKSPGRAAGEIDNRGSHFYLTMFWAQELAGQSDDLDLKEVFSPVAASLIQNEEKIMNEFKAASGKPINIGGYYKPDFELTSKAMRPSETFNSIVDSIK